MGGPKQMKTWPDYSIEQILEEHPQFASWLRKSNPDWENEYSGHVWGWLLAWEAGYATGRGIVEQAKKWVIE